jgi:GNAT superfamily N-acetyltransferase
VPEPSYRIRPARRGDREGLAGLLAELGYSNACDSGTLSWVISHPEMEVYLAVDPLDRAIGMVSFSHRPALRLKGRVATIDELAVAPAWRRKGIGKELLARAVTRLKVLGCKRIELVAPGPGIPKQLFIRSGMVEVESALFRLTELEGN